MAGTINGEGSSKRGVHRWLLPALCLGALSASFAPAPPGAAFGSALQEDPQELGLDVRVQGTVNEVGGLPASSFHLLEIRQETAQGARFIHKRVELILPSTGALDHRFEDIQGLDITRPVEVHVLPLPYSGAQRNTAQMYLSADEGRRVLWPTPLSPDNSTVELGDYVLDIGVRAMEPAPLALNVTCTGVGDSDCEIYPVDGTIHGETARLNYPEGGLQLSSGVATQVFGWPRRRQVSFFGISGNMGVLPAVTVARQGTAIVAALAHHSLDVAPTGGFWGATGALILIPANEYVAPTPAPEVRHNRFLYMKRRDQFESRAIPTSGGAVQFDSVPEGNYVLEVWLGNAKDILAPTLVYANLTVDSDQTVQL